MKELRDAIADAQLSDDERYHLLYMFNQAVQAIESWKVHHLRSLKQDKTRVSLLESLEESLGLIMQEMVATKVQGNTSCLVWKQRHFVAYKRCGSQDCCWRT